MDVRTLAQREQSIQDWLVNRLSEWLAIDAREISLVEPFANYGLSSVAAVSLSGELSDWLGIELSPILAYEYPTVEALARHLAQQVETTVA
jgi:acyl carrier protein